MNLTPIAGLELALRAVREAVLERNRAKDGRHDPGRPFPGRTRLAVEGGPPPASQPAGTSIEAVQPETVQAKTE